MRKQKFDAERIGTALLRGAEKGRVNGSVAQYVKRFKGGPDELTANANVGRLLVTLGQSGKLSQLGLLNIELGRKNEAKKCARKLEKQGEYSSAIGIYVKIKNVKGVERCAEGLRNQGYHREAGNALREMRKDLKAAECYLEGARNAQELGLSREDGIGLFSDAAEIFFEKGWKGKAAGIAGELRELRAFKEAGRIYEEAGKYGKAGECFTHGIDYTLWLAAENFIKAGRLREARECAERLESNGVHGNAARIYRLLGDTEKQFDALVLGGDLKGALELELPQL